MFDIDGTLLDTLQPLVRGLADTYEHFGVERPSDEAILATLGTPLRVQLTMFGLGEVDPDSLRQRIDYAIDRFEEHAHLEKEIAPALEAFRLVHESGIPICLVTSKSAKELELLLTRFPAGKWADATVCSSDVTHPKPHGESVELACRRLGVRPEEAVLVGDSVFDIQCARNGGAASLAVSYGASPEPALAAERPDLLLSSPEALLAWVQETIFDQHGTKELSIT